MPFYNAVACRAWHWGYAGSMVGTPHPWYAFVWAWLELLLGTSGPVSSAAGTAKTLGGTTESTGQAVIVLAAATVVANGRIAGNVGLQILRWGSRNFDDRACSIGLVFIIVHHDFNYT